jgi:hypothetical protein
MKRCDGCANGKPWKHGFYFCAFLPKWQYMSGSATCGKWKAKRA